MHLFVHVSRRNVVSYKLAAYQHYISTAKALGGWFNVPLLFESAVGGKTRRVLIPILKHLD